MTAFYSWCREEGFAFNSKINRKENITMCDDPIIVIIPPSSFWF